MRQRGIVTSVLVAFTLMVGPVWAEPEASTSATQESAGDNAEHEPELPADGVEPAPDDDAGESSDDAAADDSGVESKEQEADEGVSDDTGEAPAIEPVDEEPGETNLHVAEVEDVYVPDALETTLVLGGSYAGAMLVVNSPALLPGGGKWMGAMHVSLAAASVVYAKDWGWKLIGGATFGTLAALNVFTDMREAGTGGRYAMNVVVSLAIPMVLAGTYWGLEIWGQSDEEPAVLESLEEPMSEPEAAVEPEATTSLHLNIVPMGDGALTSLTLQF